jgi:prepilin-type N-terminal cleavage/methylation domain-containing protein
MTKKQHGFTLIELLIVVAIVAILAVVVVLTLNPAQLLRQARDSNRISDLSTMKGALTLYLADVATSSIGGAGCYAHSSSSMATCATGSRFAAGAVTTSTVITVTGGGWIPINFSSITSGSPISVEPVDPVNNATYFYAYRADSTNLVFEMNADMESTKYASGGSGDVETNDGGNQTAQYEVGTSPGLAL